MGEDAEAAAPERYEDGIVLDYPLWDRSDLGENAEAAEPAREADGVEVKDPPRARWDVGLHELAPASLGENAEVAMPARHADGAGEDKAPELCNDCNFILSFSFDPPLDRRWKQPEESLKSEPRVSGLEVPTTTLTGPPFRPSLVVGRVINEPLTSGTADHGRARGDEVGEVEPT